MSLAANRSQLISTTRHTWVVLGRSRDRVGTKLGPSRGQFTWVVTGEVRRYCVATEDAVKYHETKPMPSLRIGDSQ